MYGTVCVVEKLIAVQSVLSSAAYNTAVCVTMVVVITTPRHSVSIYRPACVSGQEFISLLTCVDLIGHRVKVGRAHINLSKISLSPSDYGTRTPKHEVKHDTCKT